jgi:hypothetical protein
MRSYTDRDASEQRQTVTCAKIPNETIFIHTAIIRTFLILFPIADRVDSANAIGSESRTSRAPFVGAIYLTSWDNAT